MINDQELQPSDEWFDRQAKSALYFFGDKVRNSFVRAHIRLAPESACSRDLLQKCLNDSCAATRIAVPFDWWQVANEFDASQPEFITVFVSAVSELTKSGIRFALNQNGEFFLMRTLVEDIEYTGYSKVNIGECVGINSTVAYITSLLLATRKLSSLMQHQNTEPIKIMFQMSGIKGRFLFADLPLNIGIPNPLYRAQREPGSHCIEISKNELDGELTDLVDEMVSSVFTSFVRYSPSPDMFGNLYPDQYKFQKQNAETHKVIAAVERGFYIFQKPAQTQEDIEGPEVSAIVKQFLSTKELFLDLVAAGPHWNLHYETRDQIDLKYIEGSKGQRLELKSYYALLDQMKTAGLVASDSISGSALLSQVRGLHLTPLGEKIIEKIKAKL